MMSSAGDTAQAKGAAFREWVERLPDSDLFVSYDPYAIAAKQRNRAMRSRDLPHGPVRENAEAILHVVGAGGRDLMRVLLCDGARLLSWVGAIRSERFTARELHAFRRVSDALRKRVRLEQLLRPHWPHALAIEAALDALDRAAFIVGPRASVQSMNARAAALLERGGRSVVDAICESQRQPSESAEFTVTPLAMPGCPTHLLAIQKLPRLGLTYRVAVARTRWNLTSRQAQVLEEIAAGAGNKEIAGRLSCALVTVENHVTELFRRSGTRSRTELVSRLFSLS